MIIRGPEILKTTNELQVSEFRALIPPQAFSPVALSEGREAWEMQRDISQGCVMGVEVTEFLLLLQKPT